MLHPQRAILIKSGDAVFRRHDRVHALAPQHPEWVELRAIQGCALERSGGIWALQRRRLGRDHLSHPYRHEPRDFSRNRRALAGNGKTREISSALTRTRVLSRRELDSNFPYAGQAGFTPARGACSGTDGCAIDRREELFAARFGSDCHPQTHSARISACTTSGDCCCKLAAAL